MMNNIALNKIIVDLEKKISKVIISQDLQILRSEFLGKNSYLYQLTNKIKDTNSIEKKREIGKEIKLLRTSLEQLINQKQQDILSSNTNTKKINLSLPGRVNNIGSIHPLTGNINKLRNILNSHSFIEKHGPEIETEWYNFNALNVHEFHPARSMQDTFYIKKSSDVKNSCDNQLLRTHTSNVQIRTLEGILDEEGEGVENIRFYSIGRVYRADNLDASHSPMFHQLEGMYVDKNVNMGNLFSFLSNLLQDFFNKDVKLRFRPSYFPFTEPSAEVDILWNNKWLEILGCGMVHRNVFRNIKLPGYMGFAFGIGIERIVMIQENIKDIRDLYSGNINFAEARNIII